MYLSKQGLIMVWNGNFTILHIFEKYFATCTVVTYNDSINQDRHQVFKESSVVQEVPRFQNNSK